jgi:membrane protein
METEAHVYALAIAASVLLSFYPFLIVMLAFCRNVLGSRAAEDAVALAINDFFAGELGSFIRNNLSLRHRLQVPSMLLLLFTANGVFEPLEVALNRAWGVAVNRSYIRNQLVSLGLIFACGALAMASLMLTAMNQEWIRNWTGAHYAVQTWIGTLFFKVAAVPLSIFALFLIYWKLPNRDVPPVQVVPVAIVVGLVLEALKYLNLIVWPLVKKKLHNEYGVFEHSVAILLWSFLAAMIVLAGAHWTARSQREVS